MFCGQELIDFIKPIYGSVLYSRQTIQPIHDLKSKLCSLDIDPTSMVTYKVCQGQGSGTKVYDVTMPRSKTFDMYLDSGTATSTPRRSSRLAARAHRTVVYYDLSPIDELLDTITAITNSDSEIPLSDRQLYILGFLDLIPTSYQTQPAYIRATFTDNNLIEITLSATGKILHGITTITYTTVGLHTHITRAILRLNFNYGRVKELTVHHIQASPYILPDNKIETFTYCTKYRGGLPVQTQPVKTWEEIFDMVYDYWNDEYRWSHLYMTVYRRLTEDGVIDGLTGRLQTHNEAEGITLTPTICGSLEIQSKGRCLCGKFIINTINQTIALRGKIPRCIMPDIEVVPYPGDAEKWRSEIRYMYPSGELDSGEKLTTVLEYKGV